jgi:hypothetical protein
VVANPRTGHRWSASEDAVVMTAHDDGRPVAGIAEALGRTPQEVWTRLAAFGRVTTGDLPTAPITGVFPRFVFPPGAER